MKIEINNDAFNEARIVLGGAFMQTHQHIVHYATNGGTTCITGDGTYMFSGNLRQDIQLPVPGITGAIVNLLNRGNSVLAVLIGGDFHYIVSDSQASFVFTGAEWVVIA